MKKKTLNFEEKLLLSKITGYSALAGAALLLSPTVAEGDIVYVDPADIVIDVSNNLYYLDMNDDEVNDVRFRHLKHTFYSTSTPYKYYMTTSSIYMLLSGGNEAVFDSAYIKKLGADYTLSSYKAFHDWFPDAMARLYYFKTITSSTTSQTDTSNLGPWASDADHKFIGIYFNISGSSHYGWIRVSVQLSPHDTKITIHDWAYEDIADVTLKTGEGETALPIELSAFEVTEENGKVKLCWQTASETENSGFVIQRKTTGAEWQNLIDFHRDPSLEGHGTTSETHNYSWLDEIVLPGMTYQYRLGDIDLSNKIVWHDAVEITVSEKPGQMPAEFGLQSAFPNPFNPTLTIRYGLTDGAQTKINILDLQGKIIANLEDKYQKAGNYELQWQAEDVASGIYLVEVTSGKKSDLKKVLLAK